MHKNPATAARPTAAARRGADGRRAQLQRFRRDVAYYAEHRERLLARHPEQWVAIFEQQLVGVAADPPALFAALQQRQIPAGQALIKHLTRKHPVLILLA